MDKKLLKNISYKLQLTDNAEFIHYKILSMIFPREFIKLNVNRKTTIKNVKLAERNINIATAFLNTKTLKLI